MADSWIPLHLHSYFSLLDGISKPKDIARRCKELGYTTCGLSDHGSISGSVAFMVAMQAAGIKPILGSELYLCRDDPAIKDETNRKLSHLPIFSKNKAGWDALIKATSYAYHPDHFYYKPRIDLAHLSEMGYGNLIAISGHPGSDLADAIFTDPRAAYNQTTISGVKRYFREDRRESLRQEAARYIEAFGRDNFFVELQVIDPEHNPAGLIVAHAMQWLAADMGLPLVATADSHYPDRTDAEDQRVLLCSSLKTTLSGMEARLGRGEADSMPFRFNWTSKDLHIPSLDDIRDWHRRAFKGRVDEEAIANTARVAEMCETYDIRRSPSLPVYPYAGDDGPDEHLRGLCRKAWSSKIVDRVASHGLGGYVDRVKRELGVIKGADLASYFLMVQDYCNWARGEGILVGTGRGSGAGCLVGYLAGITTVDPIEHGLLFERFYNPGRNTPGHISLPDIDCDFEVDQRKRVVEYIRSRFGGDHVGYIATFNSMKGRGALTDVLRAHGRQFDLVKQITSRIPKPEHIAEELQAMKERGDVPSVIRYALEEMPNEFRDWAVLNDDGTCSGPFSSDFMQAMRLEGTKRHIGMHAAGVAISVRPLSEVCPLAYDADHGVFVAAMEWPDLEAIGIPKFDVLGVAALSKIQGGRRLLRYGHVSDDN